MSDNNPIIRCLDGFSMSVQASRTHYCLPRQDNAETYEEVEVGFPSQEEELLTPWAELPDDVALTETIYPYVPVDVIATVILRHGGITEGKAPKGVDVVTAEDLFLRMRTELSDCRSFIAMQTREIAHLTKRK